MKAKTLCLVLTLLMCLTVVLPSCKKEPIRPGSAETTANETGNYGEFDCELPKELNFGNAEIQIICRDSEGCQDEFVSDGSQDTVPWAVYRRNAAVERDLGIILKMVPVADVSPDSNHTVAYKVQRAIHSGDTSYDLCMAPLYTMIGNIQGGYCRDLNLSSRIRLSKSYWGQNFNSIASQGSAQYLATGMLALTTFRYMYVVAFHDRLTEAYGIHDLYDVVNEGNWTMEYLKAATKDRYLDDGNAQRDENDVYGFVSGTRTSVDPFWAGLKLYLVRKDEDNYYSVDLNANQEHLIKGVDRIIDLFWDCEGTYTIPYHKDNVDNAAIATMFAGNKAVFATMKVAAIETRLSAEVKNYGILPFPKFDTQQESYGSYVQDQVTVASIPSNATRSDLSEAVLEYLAYQSYLTTYYAYYETALSYRYLQNPESKAMLDLIYASATYDLVFQNMVMEFGTTQMREVIDAGYNDMATKLATVKKDLPSRVDRINQLFRKLQTDAHGSD